MDKPEADLLTTCAAGAPERISASTVSMLRCTSIITESVTRLGLRVRPRANPTSTVCCHMFYPETGLGSSISYNKKEK